MAHELEIMANGEARMMYAGKAPWHGLGTAVQREVTWDAAMKLAGLDNWNVQLVPVQAVMPDGSLQTIDNAKAIVRGMDGSVFATVTDSYQTIQNEEAGAFLEAMVGEGLAMFHTAGSLFGGRKVFASCKLPGSIQVGPDQVDKYLVAMWSHDTTLALHIKWTPIRVVCWNTASAAFQIRGGRVKATDCMTIYHTKNWKDCLGQAREILNVTNIYYQRLEECFQKLVATPFRDCDFTKFVGKVYPDEEKPDGKGRIDRSKVRDEIKLIYQTGIGLDHPDVKNTRWAAYNAITEYIDHHKKYYEGKYGTEADMRMNAVIWGGGAQVKKQALELLSVP